MSVKEMLMTAIKSSNNIIIFGGVFDPVHLGHLHIYQAVKKQISFKKFIILPSKIPVLKNALPIASIKDRLAMLNLMFKNYKDVEISHYEISKTSICKSFTIDSIKHFQQRYLHANFYFVVGADRYMDFKQ
jgi:nicotinate-nucleotide adenylyltransferase